MFWKKNTASCGLHSSTNYKGLDSYHNKSRLQSLDFIGILVILIIPYEIVKHNLNFKGFDFLYCPLDQQLRLQAT